MSPSAPTPASEPVFPGGRDTAPELTPSGCGNSACLCHTTPGRQFCCLACARIDPGATRCPCGHFGCASRP